MGPQFLLNLVEEKLLFLLLLVADGDKVSIEVGHHCFVGRGFELEEVAVTVGLVHHVLDHEAKEDSLTI